MSTTTETANREIVSQRLLDFPRERIFQAWSEAQRISHWWGPDGFTNTIHEFDFRPGGAWRHTMHGPDGTNYENEARFAEIEKPGKIVIDHLSQPKFQVRATFEDRDGKTLVTFRQIFETAEVRNALEKICVPANEQNFDRLSAHLKNN